MIQKLCFNSGIKWVVSVYVTVVLLSSGISSPFRIPRPHHRRGSGTINVTEAAGSDTENYHPPPQVESYHPPPHSLLHIPIKPISPEQRWPKPKGTVANLVGDDGREETFHFNVKKKLSRGKVTPQQSPMHSDDEEDEYHF